MDKVQNRIYFLIFLALFTTTCSKQRVGEKYALKNSDFRPAPYPYTAPACSSNDTNIIFSNLDNFNMIKFNYQGYYRDMNHRFIFTSANHDTMVITMLNLFNTNCNFRVMELADWNLPFENPLNAVSLTFKMNNTGSYKMPGYLGYGYQCHCIAGLHGFSLTFCDVQALYHPFPGSAKYETRMSLDLRIPFKIK